MGALERDEWLRAAWRFTLAAQIGCVIELLRAGGKLLIDQPLRRASPGDNLGTVVRAQTLAVLEGLDFVRKRILLQFLYESDLIRKDKPVVSLVAANLSRADLSERDEFKSLEAITTRREIPSCASPELGTARA